MSTPPATPADARRFPATPPAEVLDAIAVAAAVYDELAARGEEVRFEIDPGSGRVSAQLHDTSGRTIARLSAGDVIDLAAGGSLR